MNPLDPVKALLTATAVVFTPALVLSAEGPLPVVDRLGAVRVVARMIWDAAPHNAFTDLTRWQDRWYCSFREGQSHGSYDGAARILSSKDGPARNGIP